MIELRLLEAVLTVVSAHFVYTMFKEGRFKAVEAQAKELKTYIETHTKSEAMALCATCGRLVVKFQKDVDGVVSCLTCITKKTVEKL